VKAAPDTATDTRTDTRTDTGPDTATDTRPGPAPGDAASAAALALGDDALVLAQRLGEWAGNAPVLEEDVALTNIALDLLGQARALLSLTGDEDELAFRREPHDFRNVQLVEQPNGDFADTIARQLYFSVYQELLYAELAAGGGALAPLAAKAVKEVAYHRDHAEQWTLRLGDGTQESHRRMSRALDRLWRCTGELFDPLEGLGVDLPALRGRWLERIADALARATLELPLGPDRTAWSAGGGRQGVHTEALGRMLAEMQYLHRAHPGARW
jgi:ring-1,2-phenylacetyl-CoA epoxidase subunit PaaC